LKIKVTHKKSLDIEYPDMTRDIKCHNSQRDEGNVVKTKKREKEEKHNLEIEFSFRRR
jgi:hypothetical protein